jgi:ABC-type transporter Mla maintaining outer membrane lipid asymmetry ATPase subunit MlaF
MSSEAMVLEQVRMEMAGSLRQFEVDLRVRDGEWIVVAGPSGSGKSLLLELAAGLVAPDVGRVLLFGRSWTEGSEEEQTALRVRVGTVLQRPGLLSNMTVFNNVALPLRYHRLALSAREIEQIVDRQLERLALSPARDRFPAQLTAGELRRAAIARAIVIDPDLVLLDDPIEGLDVDMIVRLRAQLDEVRAKRPFTVMMTLRCWSPLAEGADRIVALRDGRIALDGPPGAVKEAADPEMKRYLG